MKKLTWVITLIIIFFVGMIGGTVCLVSGGIQYITSLNNDTPIVKQFDGILVRITEFVDSFEDAPGSYKQTEFSAETDTLGSKLSVCDNVYKLEFVDSADGKLRAEFSGKYPQSLMPEGAGDDSPLTITTKGSVTEINLVCPSSIHGTPNGTLTIYVPVDYTGELDVSDCIGKVKFDLSARFSTVRLDSLIGKTDSDMLCADYLELCNNIAKVDLEGEFGSYSIRSCISKTEVTSSLIPTGESNISDNISQVELNLPVGTVLDLVKSDNLGRVRYSGDTSSSGIRINVSDNIGEIKISLTEKQSLPVDSSESLSSSDLSGSDLSGSDLSGSDLTASVAA